MLRIEIRNRTASVFLDGEIDHFTSRQIRSEIEETLKDERIKELILCFDRVSFMDSSGVGMLIGRYRTMMQRGGCIKANGLSIPMKKLFRLAGLHRIIQICGEEEADDA